MSPEIKIVSDLSALSRASADEFTNCAREAVAARGHFAVALSGGSTPRATFSLIAADQSDPSKHLPWDKIHVFWGDERHVPPTDPQSNYRMANETLLSKVPIPSQNVHRIPAELDAADAASDYENELHNFFHPANREWPRFDLIMLGIGPEGHTASLFPGSPAAAEDSRWVAANWVEKLRTDRITLTFPVINHAAEVMFLVAGEDKAAILQRVIRQQDAELPATRIQPESGRLLWLVDKGAGKLL